MRLVVVHRPAKPASPASFLARNAWKLGLGVVVGALLTARTAGPSYTHPRTVATNVVPTTVPCGAIKLDPGSPDTATWTAISSPYGTGSPYNLPSNDPNLPTNDPTHPNCLKPDPSNPGKFLPDDISVATTTRLVIDGSQGPVQIFSHGTGIVVNGGEIRTINTSTTNTVIFDAEADVASWDGITIVAADASHKGDGSFSYTSVQHALTAITITSGAQSSPDSPSYGLTVSNSGIGPSYFDGIDAINTPISVTGLGDGQFGTLNNIGSQGIKVTFDPTLPNYPAAIPAKSLDVENMTFGSSVPFGETGCLPLTSCAAGTIGNDAIQASFVPNAQEPLLINKSQFFRAGSYGLELTNANHPVLTSNTFSQNGIGSTVPTGTCPKNAVNKYPPIYLNNGVVDLENQVTGNFGQLDGLEAIVFNGTVSSPSFTWKTASTDPSKPLGYLLDGDLNMVGGTFKVPAGSVVKAKHGTLNLNHVTLDANDAGPKTFTSLRDSSVGIDAICSVFVQSSPPSPLPPGDWGGIDLIAGANASINNATVLYATDGVQISDGMTSTLDPTYGGNYGLVLRNSQVGATFFDSVSATRTPIAVVGTQLSCPLGACNGPSAGHDGVYADFTGSSGSLGHGLLLDSNTFGGSVDEAIRGVSLGKQTVAVTNNVIRGAGTFGIKLEGATNPTLVGNDVRNSGTGSPSYSAIDLPDIVLGDFSSAIAANTGSGNGLNAIAFHGSTASGKPLNWLTVGGGVGLGYLIDGDLTVNGDLNFANGDVAPVLGGTITVKGGTLTATGAKLTSLKQQVAGIPTCGSIFFLKVSSACPPPTAGDWGGLVLDPGHANLLTSSDIGYAATGISLGPPAGLVPPQNLTLTQTNVHNTTLDGVHSQSPLAISGGAFTSNGGHGIDVVLAGPSAVQPLVISGHTAVTSSGLDGILATGPLPTGLAGQLVQIQDATVDHAGGYGIDLVGADRLTLTNNTVTNSAPSFAAIYLNGFSGPFASINGNKGAGNGLDALVFHGRVTDNLTWQTARKTSDPSKLLGYLLDDTLSMQPGHTLTVNAGDIVKVGKGTGGGLLDLPGVSLRADNTTSSSQKVFTSLSDNGAGVAACPSALLPGCSGAAPGDWSGINLSGSGANGALVNAAVHYAATGITVSSGAASTFGSSTFGLTISRSSFDHIQLDAIDSAKTALSVTDSSVSGTGARGINADLTGATPGTPLRLSGNRFTSTGVEAILGQALRGQPVWITDNHVQGAGAFGIRLLSADQLVLRNNSVSSSGVGSGSAPRYPAIYLNAVSADFVRNVRGNVGGGNGLDAVAWDGTASTDLNWITPSNQLAIHPLGYLLDGGVTLPGGTLTVKSGDVVKSLGGPITINGGKLVIAGAATPTGSPKSNSAIFTSLKDNPSAPSNPVDASDAAAVSCPSVLAAICTPGPGDWGGLVITSNPAGLKGSGAISYGLINYANTGISLDSGPISANSEPSNFRLMVANTAIWNTSKDGITSVDTPFSVDWSFIQGAGSNGITASFFSPANCGSTTGTCVRLSITNTQVAGSGKDGIVANGLAEQPVVVSGDTVTSAGTYGIRLVGADQVSLTNNTVDSSGVSAANAYPAIYLNNVAGDFNAAISGNKGAANGLDALVFHGVANNGLTWLTPAATAVVPPYPTPAPALGFMLDGPLTVNGNLTTTGVVKVLAGGIKVNGLLQSTGTVFTSMKELSAPFACNTVFVPGACPTPVPSTDYWGGVNVDPSGTSHVTGGAIRDATSGFTIGSGELDVNGAVITNVTGYAVHAAGSGNALVTCASIHGNGGGIFSEGSTATSIADSNLYGNSSAGIDLNASVDTTATNVWWGVYPPLASQHSATHVTINNALRQEPPSVKASGGSIALASDNTNALNGHFGKGTLTVTLTFDRAMNLNVPLQVTFANQLDGVVHPVAGDWTHADKYTWVGHALVDGTGTTGAAGVNMLSVSQGVSCAPDGNTVMNNETQNFNLDFGGASVDDSAGANHLGAGSATLNGSVNAQGWSQPSGNPNTETYAFIESAPLGTALPDPATVIAATAGHPSTLPGYTLVGHTGVPVNVTQTVVSLLPNHTYHYEVIAVDLNAITPGADQTFTTTGPVAKFLISDPLPVTAGTPVSVTVTAEDGATPANVVADYTGSVHLTSTDAQATFKLNSSDPPAPLPTNLAFTTGNLGVRTLTVFFKTSGAQTLTATDSNGITGSGGGVSVTPNSATRLAIGQQPTDTTAGLAINPAVTVKVEDQFGNVLTGDTGTEHPVTIALTSTSPSATLLGTLIQNDVGGVATFNDLVIKKANLGYGLEATATGLTLADSSGFKIVAAPAKTLVVLAPATAAAGSAFDVTVTARDPYGNTATGYLGTVHVTSGDAQAVLPADYAFVAGDSGVHTFTAGVTLKTAGSQTVTATDTVTSSITGNQAVTVSTTAAVSLQLSGLSSAMAGTAQSVTVTAKDAFNNTATSYTGTIHFTSSDGQAALPSDYTFVAGDSGTHAFTAGVTLKTVGSQAVTATDTLTSTIKGTQSVTISPAAAATLQLSGLTGGTAGTAQTATVTAKDAYNNTATGYTGTVHFTSSDGQAALPANYAFVAFDNGVHGGFPVTLKTAATQSVTVTDTAAASLTAMQSGLVVSPAAANTLQVSGLSNGTAGVAETATVTAKDVYNNTATGYLGTVHFTSGDSQAALPTNYTFIAGDNGSHGGLGVTFKTAGSQTLTGTDTGTASITGGETVTVSPAAAVALQVSGLSAGVAGVAQTATVIARDPFNNTATGYTGTVHFTSGDVQAVLPANYTFVAADNGIHAGLSVTLKTAGAQTLTGTDTSTASITGGQTVTISPAAAATLQVTGLSSGTAGVAQTATVTAIDPFSNTATGYTGTVHFTSGDVQAVLPANYAFVAGDNGVHTGFSVTLKTAGSQTVTGTDTVTVSIAGGQTVTISPAAATTLQLSGLGSGTAGVAQSATVAAFDAYANTATGYTGTVHFTSSDGQAALPANYTFLLGDAGSHSFAGGISLKTSGTQSVTVADATTATLTATQSGLVVSPAAAATLQVTGLSNGTAGVPQTATVTAKDAFNNAATGYAGTVHFTSSDLQVVLPGNYTFVPADNGVHGGFSVTLKTAGSQAVTATDTLTNSIAGSESVMISPAAAASLQLAGLSSATAGAAQTSTVTALDAYGNVATGYTGTVHFSSSDVQAVLPANYTFLASDNGVHGGFGVTLKTAATQSVTVNDTVSAGLTVTVGSLVITPASAASLQLSGLGGAAAGTPQTASVTAKDLYGNTATGYTGTVHFTSTDSQAALPADYTFVLGDAGVHGGFAVTLKTAGAQTVTARDTVTSSVNGSQTVTITSAAAASLQLSGLSGGVAGTAQSATVTAKDAFNNTAMGYTGTVHFTSTDSQAVLPADYAFIGADNGIHTFTIGVTLKTAATQSVTATDTLNGVLTATQNGLVITPAAAASLALTYTPPVTHAVAFNLTVTAKDAYGNTATGYAGTVHFTSTDPAPTLPADYTFTIGLGNDNGVHVFSVTLSAAGSPTVTATDTVTATITGTVTVTVS